MIYPRSPTHQQPSWDESPGLLSSLGGTAMASSLEGKSEFTVKITQSCSTLCNPMHYTVHGILQAKILEWVAFSFSRGSSQSSNWTQVSNRWILYQLNHKGSPLEGKVFGKGSCSKAAALIGVLERKELGIWAGGEAVNLLVQDYLDGEITGTHSDNQLDIKTLC